MDKVHRNRTTSTVELGERIAMGTEGTLTGAIRRVKMKVAQNTCFPKPLAATDIQEVRVRFCPLSPGFAGERVGVRGFRASQSPLTPTLSPRKAGGRGRRRGRALAE